MVSKLQKKKKIYSLLNSQSSSVQQELELIQAPTEAHMSGAQELQHNRLINQIYHFHKSIIQNINAGLITMDLSGEITFANQSAARLLGYEMGSLLGKNVQEFFEAAEEGTRFVHLCSFPGKKIDDWESRFVDGDGKIIIVGINAAHLQDENNDFEGAVLLLRDLTDLLQLRNQVERMERLALLGELSAGIAHEIRNPLAGIKVATQVLQESLGADVTHQKLLQRVVDEVDKANRLLKQFFKFARPARPKFGFYRVEQIIDTVYLLLAPQFMKAGIRFHKQIAADLPPVYVDETQIDQVILNLLLNAVEAMKGGGELKVHAILLSLKVPNVKTEHFSATEALLDYVAVEISDTGEGISEENLTRIFNPFFTTKPDGVGLGLSISSRLVEENRGKLNVVSRVGEGSTFTLLLPTRKDNL